MSEEIMGENMEEKMGEEKEILIWQVDTWGNWGQRANLYTFIVDLDTGKQEPIFKYVETRHVNNDSRKNKHRKTFVKKSELSKLNGKILKIVNDYKSSSRHVVNRVYYRVENGELVKISAEKNLRDQKGFYDLLEIDGKQVKVRKDSIEVVQE